MNDSNFNIFSYSSLEMIFPLFYSPYIVSLLLEFLFFSFNVRHKKKRLSLSSLLTPPLPPLLLV